MAGLEGYPIKDRTHLK